MIVIDNYSIRQSFKKINTFICSLFFLFFFLFFMTLVSLKKIDKTSGYSLPQRYCVRPRDSPLTFFSICPAIDIWCNPFAYTLTI